jgi:DNA-binding LacI/PurR family transcriptional regulator
MTRTFTQAAIAAQRQASGMGSGKTTSFDIAHRAGVSQATVSRALRNSPLVNPETRERIQRIAREMNYRVDRSAAGLRSQQARTIALLLFEDTTSDDSQINPFFMALLSHITRCASKRSYDVLLSFQQLRDNWQEEYVTSNRADGIILLGYGDYGRIADRLRRLHDNGLKYTIWGAVTPELEGHAIGCDNSAGGEMATRHLLELGRRRIAYIGSTSDDAPEFKQRYEGYARALQEAGIETNPDLVAMTENLEASAFEATQYMVDQGHTFDAVFAASDLIAFGAMKCLQKNGFEIPGHVSVVGFDDLPAATYFSPALTTIRQDTSLAGQALTENLIRMIDGEPVASLLISPSLVVRGSCGGQDF